MARWAVEHRGRRVAWGLRDVAAAQRWLSRLTTPVQLKLENPQPTIRRVVATRPSTRQSERLSSVLRAYDRAPYWTA